MGGSLGDDTLMSIPLHAPSHHKRLQTLGVRGRTAAGGVPKWEAGSPGSALGSPHPAEFFPSGAAPASPVPAVPSSRSGTPCRSSRRPRKISCSFSKCSEEAAEVAMAQAARELRPLRLRALGPLPPQQSAAQPRSHRCSRTSASRNQALPGSSEPDAPPLAVTARAPGAKA